MPVSNPPRRTPSCKDHGKHLGRNANGFQDNTRIEIHIREQLALDEVIIFQRNLLEFLRHAQQRIVFSAQLIKHFIADAAYNSRSWIIVLVDTVTETHEAEGIVLVLGPGDKLLDAGFVANLIQHIQHGLVGTAMGGTPQGSDAGRDTGIGVGAGGASEANGRGRCILFVIGVQQEQGVHGLGQDRADIGFFAGCAKHHVQEVFCEAHAILRVHERLSHAVLEAHRRQCRHFGDDTVGGQQAMLGVIDVQVLMVEGRQAANHSTEHGHGVSVAREAAEELVDRFVYHGVVTNRVFKFTGIFLAGKFTVEQEIAGFEEIGFFCQLFDWVTAMQQHPGTAIDVSYVRFAGSGGNESRVIGKYAFCDQSSNIDDIRSSTS